MRIITTQDYGALSAYAASFISAQIILKPNSVLGLATGSSPIGTYKKLINKHLNDGLDFSLAKSVNLDEYKGLSPDNSQSYRYFMEEHLFGHINIKKENTFVPNGLEQDSKKACETYEEIITRLGGIDLQLLGLGHNGHIGFNEPSDIFPGQTHLVDLSPSTIEANTRFFQNEDGVPKQAYTMGIGTIMKARKILVIVSGKDKAEILKKVIKGPVTPQVPASILQFHHDVTLVADEAALSLLSR